MPWTPNGLVEPHAYAQVASGVLPFTPYAPNRGSMGRRGEELGGVTLTFAAALEPIPGSCFVESLRFVWLHGAAMVAADVAAPAGWTVADLVPLPGWPGTSVLLTSPAEFEGLVVSLVFGEGVEVTRIVAQTEWRGSPADVIIAVGNS